MIERKICNNRDEWLKARKGTIGGSDAGAVLGKNPWKDNVTLWEELTGRREPEDISGKDLVRYGINAEPHIRALFGLDYPKYTVWYEENNILFNDDYPLCHYSADGMIYEGLRTGVLEIKTSTVSGAVQAAKWKDNHLPDTYYIQVLFGMMMTEADFAVLRALLHYPKDGEPDYITIRDYFIERKEVEEDIAYIAERVKVFAECIHNDMEPPRILPSI